ncbi:MAG TPA: hypothetical protein VEO19_05100 [Terriglobia bacterium]|nr:hypothetical protein [Terriglobia bacterium]
MNRRNFLKSSGASAWLASGIYPFKAGSADGVVRAGGAAAASGSEATLDLSQAVIVQPATLSRREQKAVSVLAEEVERRTGIQWQVVNSWPSSVSTSIIIGRAAALEGLKPGLFRSLFARPPALAAEGYALRAWAGAGGPVVAVLGADERGILFGVGGLLRALRMVKGQVTIGSRLNLSTSPKYSLRGHQLGYRPKTNSYDGWNVPMWDQYIRDLAVFGTNAIELIPPRSDDAPDSPHFPLPPMQMMIEMSRICDEYGLDVWIWYPAMDANYADPRTVEFALHEWEQVFRALPRIDVVFVPGGDPGHTRPKYLLALLQKQGENLHKYHPKGKVWISPQSFNREWTSEFYQILQKDQPSWLSGVVYGPQNCDDLPTLRKQIPQQYPIRLYPDITHSVECQFPVPDWDTAYAYTEGREVINPRAEGAANIFRRDAPYSIGFLSYSEGCNDDVNKIVWSALAWDPEAKVIDVLRDYSRYFMGDQYTDGFAHGLLSLERNWQGPLLSNENVYITLRQFQVMEDSASPHDLLKWRFQQALYRAYYDAYIRRRLLSETEIEDQIMNKLEEIRRVGVRPGPLDIDPGEARRRTSELDAPALLSEAEAIVEKALSGSLAPDWRSKILELGEALYQSIRMQLSVERYEAEAVSRGANLDTLDAPITNLPWLRWRIRQIHGLASEQEQMKAVEEILNWANPGPGGFYDDLGDLSRQAHLVRGVGGFEDPEFRASSLVGFDYPDPFGDQTPISWKRWAESLFDAPLELRYTGFDPQARYRVRVVYSGDERAAIIRMRCNEDLEIHPYMHKPWPPRPLEFDIPPEATAGGELNLIWNREPGLGGNGRGCQVAEVWLLKRR